LERRGFSVRSMYRVLHKVDEFNRLNYGVALTSACRTKVRTNDLQLEQLPVLVRYATVGNYREVSRCGGRISANSIQKRV
jgi:hypothetical protein